MRKMRKFIVIVLGVCYLATLPQWGAIVSTIESIAQSEVFLKIKDNATTLVGKYVDSYMQDILEKVGETDS